MRHENSCQSSRALWPTVPLPRKWKTRGAARPPNSPDIPENRPSDRPISCQSSDYRYHCGTPSIKTTATRSGGIFINNPCFAKEIGAKRTMPGCHKAARLFCAAPKAKPTAKFLPTTPLFGQKNPHLPYPCQWHGVFTKTT